jgi:hypothetical protein
MPRMKVGSQYYTAADVKKKLNITQGELLTFVRNGTLTPVTPPGKKQNVYRRAEVDELALERQLFMTMPLKTSSTFSRATRDDMKALVEITRILFGLRESFGATLARLEEHSANCYAVTIDGEMAGYALMLPAEPEKMAKLLRHQEFVVETEAETENEE